MHKSIPEYIEELNRDQLYSIIEHANDKLEKLDKADKVGVWQVEDNDIILAEFKLEDCLLAIDKLKVVANEYYLHRKYSKKDLELSIKYDYDELFGEDL